MNYLPFDEFCALNDIEPNSSKARELAAKINLTLNRSWKSRNVRAEWSLLRGRNAPETWAVREDADISLLKDEEWYIKLIFGCIKLAIFLICLFIFFFFICIKNLIKSLKTKETTGVIFYAIGSAIFSAGVAFGIVYITKFKDTSFECIAFATLPAILFLSIPFIYGIYQVIRKLKDTEDKSPKQIAVTIGLCLLFLVGIGSLITGTVILSDHANSDFTSRVNANYPQAPQTISDDGNATPKQPDSFIPSSLESPQFVESVPSNAKQPVCPPNQVYCNGYCIDPMTNEGYCGAQAGCVNYTNCYPPNECIDGNCVEKITCQDDEEYYNGHCIVKKVGLPPLEMPIEERLTFLKSIKSKKSKKVDFLIFTDKAKSTQCIVSMQNNHDELQNNHWCIPITGAFSGELDQSLVSTKTARLFPDIYPYCYNLIKMGSYMPNGLATFFQKFNPDYYNSNLKWFAENAEMTIYKNSENLDFAFDPYNTYNVPERYYKHPLSVVTSMNFDYNEPGYMKRWEWNSLDKEKIYFIEELPNNISVHKGDIILTASAKKGERKLHRYWRVESDNKIYATIYDGRVLRPNEESELPMYGMPVIPIYDLSNAQIWQSLDSHIQAGMKKRDAYCQAANLSLNNEAISEQWASIPADSKLLKIK